MHQDQLDGVDIDAEKDFEAIAQLTSDDFGKGKDLTADK